MYKALDCLESTTSPKIDNDEVEANLKIIEKNVSKMEQKDENGKMVCYYPDVIYNTVKLMNETYKLLLIKLEEKGMLTRKQKDLRKAMGDFGG